MFTQSDTQYGGRKWRWWPYFSAWNWTLGIGAQQQLIALKGKKCEPRTVRVYTLNFYLRPWKWHFGKMHSYYDGPHCALDLGPVGFYWEPITCKECEVEVAC